MDPTEILRKAVKAVDDAKVPEDLRAAAFERAIELLSGASLAGPQAAASQPEAVVTHEEGRLAAAAQRLRVPLELMHDIFHTEGDEIGIGLAASRFDKSRSGATRQLALLVAAVRQASGLEEWTSTGPIRDVCRDYGKFDSANFASTIRGLDEVFNFRGRAHHLEVRLTRPGYERAAQLIQELAGA